MSERAWTTQQHNCIYDRGRTVLVSAAAGSGKTTVLVERIIQKLIHSESPIDVDRLLVMTFTNAAAAEMKQRIAKELTKRLAECPDNLHLQRQQLALPRAAFGTVHSFCFNLIRENAYRLNLSPQFKIAEEQQLLLLKKEAMETALQECYEEGDPAFLELVHMLSNGKNDHRLMSAVESIYTFIQSHPYPDQWLSRMETVYEIDKPLRETVWGELLLHELTDTLIGYKKLLSAASELCQHDQLLTANYLPSLQTDVVVLDDLLTDIENGLSWDDCFARAEAFSLTPLKQIRKPTDENAKRRVTALRDTVRKRITSSAKLFAGTEGHCLDDLQKTHKTVAALYAIVRRFSAHFSEKKREQNWLDFNDAEHYALQLLTEPISNGHYRRTELAIELSKQYDEIMVDEYQDTNASQDMLFSALSRDESNLFYVGDVKQSIYRFRQAMPELFIRRRTSYAPYGNDSQNPVTITLGNNFRSRREVTDSVNFVFRQLMTEQSGGLNYDEQEELVCSARYEAQDGHETECLILDTKPLKDLGIDSDTAQARLIAERIRRMIGTPCVSENGAFRPARYGDFCILLRSKKDHAAAYRNELERLGIPVAPESSGTFLNTAEIRLTLSLLRAVDNPMLDIPLSAVMLSPLFGFTPDDLATIRLLSPDTAFYVAVSLARKKAEPSLAARCGRFTEQLDRYRLWAASLTIDALVRRIYEDTALPSLVSVRTGGAARKGNLQQLHSLCQRFEKNGFRGLSAFIRYIDNLQEQGGDFPAASTAAGGDAVSILSIHGSKGLEFPIVFLAGLGTGFNTRSLSDDLLLHPTFGAGIRCRDPRTLNRYDTLPRKALSIAIRNDSRAEELRVLYVALTRAREKLILVMAQKDPLVTLEELAATLTNNVTIPSSLITSASSMGEWILAALLRHPSGSVLRNAINREDLPTLSAETQWNIELCDIPYVETIAEKDIEPSAEPDEALTAAVLERMQYRYPHTALANVPAKLAASEVAHKQRAAASAALSRPSFMESSGLTSAERGTALHDFLLFASFEKAMDGLETEISRLVSRGFLSQQQADSLDRRHLATFFGCDLFERMRTSSRLLREYRFTARLSAHAVEPSLPADTSEFLVIQGITDCVFEEDGQLVIVDYKTDRVRTADELLERYRSQLLLYRQALETALQLPVKECLLYSFSLDKTISVD